MNGKRAKAIRRLNAAVEQEALAYQQVIRQALQEPTKTMSMADFNKSREKAAGIGVIATTPRTPDNVCETIEDSVILSEPDMKRLLEGLADEQKVGSQA